MEDAEYRVMFSLEQSYWWFLGKQHLIKGQLQKYLSTPQGNNRILDIGSGTGINLKLLGAYGEAYGTDVSREAIEFLRRRGLGRLVRADADRPLPFKDHSFSLITCLDVLEHLERDRGLLKEMLRVCREGGRILITVPAFMLFWSPHDVALHHKRRYTRRQILRSLRPLNCRVLMTSYFNCLLSIPILITRRVKGLLSNKGRAQSDFFLQLPPVLNRGLASLFKLEISLLRFLRYPFGISILVVLEKSSPPAARAMVK